MFVPPPVESDPNMFGGPWRTQGAETGACTLILTLRAGPQGFAIDRLGGCADATLRLASTWRTTGTGVQLLDASGAVIAAYRLDGPDRLTGAASHAGLAPLARAPMY